jgi:DNA repair protein RadC
VLAAPPHRLRAAGGCDRAATGLPLVHRAMLYSLADQLGDRPLLASTDLLLAYLRSEMGSLPAEAVHVLFLDASLRLIRNERMFHGTISECPFYAREVVRRGLELGAASLILVHNHPSGDPTPSDDDRKRTRDLIEAARLFDIQVVDHLIIARTECRSMRAMGYF